MRSSRTTTPVIVSVKSPAALDLPLSLTTCLITVSVAGTSSFVIVQVFCSPAVTVPEQPEAPVCA